MITNINEFREYLINEGIYTWNKHRDTKWSKLDSNCEDARQEYNSLNRQRIQLNIDMEQELGSLAETNELETEQGVELRDDYGRRLEDLDNQIKQAKNIYDTAILAKSNYEQLKTKVDPIQDVKKILMNNIDSVKSSFTAFKERTLEEQAAIFKTRFQINDDIDTIVQAIKLLNL